MSQKPKENCVSFFIRSFPRTLRDHFKAYCALRGVTMNDKLIDLVRKLLSDEANKSVKNSKEK